jgi:hypothetical protein
LFLSADIRRNCFCFWVFFKLTEARLFTLYLRNPLSVTCLCLLGGKSVGLPFLADLFVFKSAWFGRSGCFKPVWFGRSGCFQICLVLPDLYVFRPALFGRSVCFQTVCFARSVWFQTCLVWQIWWFKLCFLSCLIDLVYQNLTELFWFLARKQNEYASSSCRS